MILRLPNFRVSDSKAEIALQALIVTLFSVPGVFFFMTMDFMRIIERVLVINKECFLHVFSCPLSTLMLFSIHGVLPAFKARAKNIPELIFSQDYTETLVLDIAGGFVVSRSFSTQLCRFTRHHHLAPNTTFKNIKLQGPCLPS